jgi:hypothetical protein
MDTEDYEFKITRWKNPTANDVRFEIFHDPGRVQKVSVLAGGTKELSSDYDQAIRTVRGGVVVGGLAPQLEIEGQKSVPIHEALGSAAALGDIEREYTKATGLAPGGKNLDALKAMQIQIAKLQAQLDAAGGTGSAAEDAKRAQVKAEAEARAAKEQAEMLALEKAAAETSAKTKDAELEALKRQLLELQTTPDHAKGGSKPR